MEKDLSNIKKKYAISKHHAWAGSILLAIVLAIRIFFETSNINEYNQLILIIGFFVILYMLISLILTYKYSSSLSYGEKPINVTLKSDDFKEIKINEKYDKNYAKIQKKKSKEKFKEFKKSK
jgi:purine-cytosine permease-like protein